MTRAPRRERVVWTRLDDRFPWNPKVVGLSDAAFREYVTALCYCAAHLTDGAVPKATVHDPDAAGELVRAGLWMPVRSGWMVHDFLAWNPTAESVVQRRKASRERMRQQRRTDDGRYSGSDA